MELRYFIIRRLLVLIPTLIGLSIFVFLLMWAYGPCNLVSVYYTVRSHNCAVIAPQEGIYLNDPVLTYLTYVEHLITGNWGIVGGSGFFLPQGQVLYYISIFFPNTLQLALAATVLSLLIAIPLGTYIGSKPNSAADHFGRIFSLSGYAMPTFWLGYLLIFFFGQGVSSFPTNVLGFVGNGLVNYHHSLPDWVSKTTLLSSPTHILLIDSLLNGDPAMFVRAVDYLILPVLTITYGILAGILRFIRAGMVDSANQEYVKTARAKGVPEKVIIKKHIRRNALLPTITVIGLLISSLLGGVVVVEEVFTYYGIGYLLIQAINPRSFEVWLVMGGTMVFALILVMTNLIVDVLYAYLDPRIRY